jgi:ADP-ribosylarginine hydrolase
MTKISLKEKIEASIMLASFFETIGYNNGVWEFNYQIRVNNLADLVRIWMTMIHEFIILGGATNISATNKSSSDDTIMIIDTARAVSKGGGEDNYIKEYLASYDLMIEEIRTSGINTLNSLKLLKNGITLKNMKSSGDMGGNGASMRTGPIGLMWYKNVEKVISESIIASRLTHNYYIGFLGGMVSALFTSFAMNNIPAHKWVEELIHLYNKKIIHKYYPENHNIKDLDEYMGYWKKYQETRISKLKFKNSLESFIYPESRLKYLISFYPDSKIKELAIKGEKFDNFKWDWFKLGASGLDSCIYAYDCLLMSMSTPNSKTLDLNNIEYNWETFMMLVAIHPGDNDTTGAIGGIWFGALNGFQNFNKDRLKELEFYPELKNAISNIIKSMNL